MKKWLIVGLVLLLIIGTVAGLLITKNNGGNGSVQAGNNGAMTIQVPDGPKIKVTSSSPPELQITLDDLKVDSYWQLVVSGTLKNVSDKTIAVDEVGFLLDGVQEANWYNVYPLKPQEEAKILKSVLVGEKSKALEVKVLRFRVVGNPMPPVTPPVTNPPPTTEPPVTNPPPVPNTNEPTVKEQWLVQTSDGPITIIYRESTSVKGKIKVWVDEREKKLYQQNLLSAPLRLIFFAKYDGRIGSSPAEFGANQTIVQSIDGSDNGAKKIEFWYVIN